MAFCSHIWVRSRTELVHTATRGIPSQPVFCRKPHLENSRRDLAWRRVPLWNACSKQSRPTPRLTGSNFLSNMICSPRFDEHTEQDMVRLRNIVSWMNSRGLPKKHHRGRLATESTTSRSIFRGGRRWTEGLLLGISSSEISDSYNHLEGGRR